MIGMIPESSAVRQVAAANGAGSLSVSAACANRRENANQRHTQRQSSFQRQHKLANQSLILCRLLSLLLLFSPRSYLFEAAAAATVLATIEQDGSYTTRAATTTDNSNIGNGNETSIVAADEEEKKRETGNEMTFDPIQTLYLMESTEYFGEQQNFEKLHILTMKEQEEDDGNNWGNVGSNSSTRNKVAASIESMKRYMIEDIYAQPGLYGSIFGMCMNAHEDCVFWALTGHCDDNNPEQPWMFWNCAPACQRCDWLLTSVRCPVDATDPAAWQQPNDLHRVFQRIVALYGNKRGDEPSKLTVWSQPKMTTAQMDHHVDGNIEDGDSPWVVSIDDFLSVQESKALMLAGARAGYEEQRLNDYDDTTIGIDSELTNGTSSGRRSSSNGGHLVAAWCEQPACYYDPTVQQVLRRIEQLTLIHEQSYEYMQLFKYHHHHQASSKNSQRRYDDGDDEDNGYHHDFAEYTVNRPQGPRILTLHFFLNDCDGAMQFSVANNNNDDDEKRAILTIPAKQGRVVLWPSVKNSAPFEMDPRTSHRMTRINQQQHNNGDDKKKQQGVVQYGANVWIHQRDFKTPYKNYCS